jgi:Putative zinc-finger
MDDCAEVRERLGPWVAGEIDPEKRHALEAHLGRCAPCAAEATRLRLALDLYAADDVPDPGPAYWSEFRPRLRTRISNWGRRRRILRTWAAIAASLLIVAGLAILRTRQPRPIEGSPHHVGQSRPVARAMTVEEAEERLREALRQAKEAGQDPRDLGVILDDVAPADSLDAVDRADSVSPDEDHGLSDDRLDPRS